MSQFALISTVDSMGEGFPSHCVLLFDSEREAILHAVDCILAHDKSAAYVPDEEVWTLNADHFDDPDEFLDAWQGHLDMTEYFHVLPVVKAAVPSRGA